MATNYAQFKRENPTGLILPWSTSTAPAGFLLCDGGEYSRTDYAALFAIISTDYGNGDGSSTFNVPDLRGKQVVFDDAGNTYTLAASAGANTVNVQPTITKGGNINATINGNVTAANLDVNQIPNHTHGMFHAVAVNSGNPINLTSRNLAVARTAGSNNNNSTGYNMIPQTANNSAADVTVGTTGNTGSNTASHNHGDNFAANVNYDSFTLNSSSESVTLLASSLVLNAIIKF